MTELESIADQLIGTCDSLDSVFDRLDYNEYRNNQVVLDAIDGQVFECQECSWWCEISEMTDEGTCQDCRKDDEE